MALVHIISVTLSFVVCVLDLIRYFAFCVLVPQTHFRRSFLSVYVALGKSYNINQCHPSCGYSQDHGLSCYF